MRNNIPSAWSIQKFDDVCLKITDGSHYSPKTKESGYDYITVKDIGANGSIDFFHSKKISKDDYLMLVKNGCKPLKGDVLFSKDGTVGKVAFVNEDRNFVVLSSLAIIRPDQSILIPEYLKYLLASPSVLDGFIGLKAGAAIKRIVLKTIKNYRIPIAPLPDQRRIVNKLDSLFERIDKAIALTELNVVRAEQLVTSVLNDAYSDLDCDRVQIHFLVEKQTQINPVLSPTLTFTYIDISSIDKAIQVITDPNSFIGKDAPSRAKKAIRKGDIVFATTRPNLKNIAVVEEDYKNPVASTGLCVLKSIPEKIDNRFLFFYLISNKIQEQIVPFIRGAQYPAISDKDLLNCTIPLPILKTQQAITTYLSSMLKKQRALVESQKIRLVKLQTLKSSLLDAAFRGDI